MTYSKSLFCTLETRIFESDGITWNKDKCWKQPNTNAELELLINVPAEDNANWTVVCHGNKEVGAALSWNFPMDKVKEIAMRGQRVKIQDKGKPERSVTSRFGSFPIVDIRKGRTIGESHGTECT